MVYMGFVPCGGFFQLPTQYDTNHIVPSEDEHSNWQIHLDHSTTYAEAIVSLFHVNWKDCVNFPVLVATSVVMVL